VDEHGDTEDDTIGEVQDVVDLVGPELARCSVLADELARLLLPAGLFS
jgi:hypothetical protein